MKHEETTTASAAKNANQATIITDPNNIQAIFPIRMQSQVVRGFGRGSSELGIPTANLDCELLFSSSTTNNNNNGSNAVGCWSVPLQQTPASLKDLPTGIYWGYARILRRKPQEDDQQSSSSSLPGDVYTAAISIGYNPTYGNEQKTVEPHLIASSQDPQRHSSSCGETVLPEFYDSTIRVSVCGYLRPELPFEGIDKLIQAIKQDILDATRLGELAKSTLNETMEAKEEKSDGDNNGQEQKVQITTAKQEKAWVASDEDIRKSLDVAS